MPTRANVSTSSTITSDGSNPAVSITNWLAVTGVATSAALATSSIQVIGYFALSDLEFFNQPFHYWIGNVVEMAAVFPVLYTAAAGGLLIALSLATGVLFRFRPTGSVLAWSFCGFVLGVGAAMLRLTPPWELLAITTTVSTGMHLGFAAFLMRRHLASIQNKGELQLPERWLNVAALWLVTPILLHLGIASYGSVNGILIGNDDFTSGFLRLATAIGISTASSLHLLALSLLVFDLGRDSLWLRPSARVLVVITIILGSLVVTGLLYSWS